MMLIAALVVTPIGMVLAAVLTVALASVFSMSFLLAGASLLPLPISHLIQVALASPLITSWIGVLIVVLVWIGITFVFYWIASANVTLPVLPATGLAGTNALENLARGGLIGICTGANFVFLMLIFGMAPFGVLVAWLVPTVGLMSAVPAFSNNPTFQIVLGWTALAMPMVWPMTFLGWLAMAFNIFVAGIGGPTVAFFRLWTRGNLIMHGGLVQGCVRTLFNLGNFTIAHGDVGVTTPWFNPATPIWPFCPAEQRRVFPGTVMGEAFHESSHELNLAAFGWVYHLVGFADEWAAMPWSGGVILGANAHSELCAESGLRGFGRNFLDMWLPAPPPPAGPAPASNIPAVAVVAVTPAAGVVVTTLPAPAAGIGLTVACTINTGVTMSSAGSADPDAFPTAIGRLWRIENPPPGSTAAILGTTTGAPTDTAATIVPDVGAVFPLSLTVTDGSDGFFAPGIVSLPISIEVVAAMFVPVPLNPAAGVPLPLDGTPSTGVVTGVATPLTFSWTVVAVPAGSARLGDVLNGPTPTFTPDVAGPPGVASWAIDLTVATAVSPAGGGAPINLTTTSRLTF